MSDQPKIDAPDDDGEEEKPFDASDAKSVSKRAKTAKQRERELDTALFAIMSRSETRAWMWELLSKTHMFETSFVTNALQTAFNEGQRNVGLWLIAQVQRLAPQEYLLMVQESKDS